MSVTTTNPDALWWKYKVGGITTKDGVIVEWPDSLPTLTQTLINEIEAEWTASEGHKANRRKAYPSIQDQLDDIYHNGIDEWKKTIKAVKDKYPKG